MTEGQIQRKRVFVRKCGEFEITQFGLVGFNCRCEKAIQSCNPECCVDCCLDYIPKLTIFFVLIYFFCFTSLLMVFATACYPLPGYMYTYYQSDCMIQYNWTMHRAEK